MAIHIRRRELLVALGGAAACPVVARAQQPAMPVIGYLGAESPTAFASRVRAFRQGLGETGYVEGRNVAIEFRWAQGQHERLAALSRGSDRSAGGSYCRARRRSCRARGKIGDYNHTDRLRDGR